MMKLTASCLLLIIVAVLYAQPHGWSKNSSEKWIENPSFESDSGWRNLEIGSNEYYAPVEGTRYAVLSEVGNVLQQRTSLQLTKGETFYITVWARSIYDERHSRQLMSATQQYPDGSNARACLRVSLSIQDTTVSKYDGCVSPETIRGAPEDFSNDDGGNVWVDGGYRHAFSESRFIQEIDCDPIHDPWEIAPDFDAYERAQEDRGAVCPVIVHGQKRLYVSTFEDPEGKNEEYNAIQFIEPQGDGDPNYEWPKGPPRKYENLVLSHAGDEEIIAFDPHVFFDESEQRLWMAWGGNFIAVTELNPETGLLLKEQNDPEVMSHEHIHSIVADRASDHIDTWTGDNEWIEGAALYRKGDYWYLFASYGSLMKSYTIRMGRSHNPMGPYLDKDGIALTQFNKQKNRFGNSFFLGDDGSHLVPGHPHFWEEHGQTFVGYDYRTSKQTTREGEEYPDLLGIRKVYWVHGWPTIWTPITVSISAADHPEFIGENIVLRIEHTGDAGSMIAIDDISCTDGVVNKYP